MARIRRPRWLRAKRYIEYPNIKFVSPCTKWTMNVMLLIVFLASVVASVLLLITVISDGMIIAGNSNNVMYDATDSGGTTTRVILVPQFQVDLGMIRFCTSAKCFQRSDRNLLPIFPFTNNSKLVSPYSVLDQFPSDVASAFENVTREALQFGYGSSTYCGGSTKSIQSIALLSFAAAVIGLVFSVCLIGTSGVLLVYVTQYDPVSDPHWVPELDEQPTKEQRTRLKKLLKQNQTNQRARISLRHVIVVLGAIAFVFLIISLISEQFQLRRKLHCGTSFCASYKSSMHALLETINATGSTEVTCRYGFGYICLYVGAMASVVAFACSIVFQVCDIFYVTDELGMERCARLGLIANEILATDPPKPGGGAGKGYGTLNQEGAKDVKGLVPDLASFEAPSPTATGYEVESNDGRPAALLRDMNWDARKNAAGSAANPLLQFYEDERQARMGIARAEAFEFLLELRLPRRKLWRNERLRIVHQWSLNWCIGPQMDFYLEETFRRQEILTEYHSALRMIIFSMESRATTPEEAYEIQMSTQNIEPLEDWLALASLDRIVAMQQQPDEDDDEALQYGVTPATAAGENDDVDVDELFQTAHWIAMTERHGMSFVAHDVVDKQISKSDSDHDEEEGSLVEVSSISSNSTAHGDGDADASIGTNPLAETAAPHRLSASVDDVSGGRATVGNNTFFKMSYEELVRRAQRPTCYSTRLHYRNADKTRSMSALKLWRKQMAVLGRSASSRTVGTEEEEEEEGEMGYSLPLSTVMGTATTGSEAHAASVDLIRQHVADASDLDEMTNEYSMPTLQNTWRQKSTPSNSVQLPTLSNNTGSTQRMDVAPPKTRSTPASWRSNTARGYANN